MGGVPRQIDLMYFRALISLTACTQFLYCKAARPYSAFSHCQLHARAVELLGPAPRPEGASTC